MRWYFDFISPFAYLQSTRLPALAAIEPVQCVPVLFAGLLDHWGQLGPAELAPKRQWTFEHVTWIAHRDGVDLTLPSHHPFNPLPLLRLSQHLGNSPDVVRRLFAFVWIEGHVPQDPIAFATLLDELGVSPAALTTDTVKQAIRQHTQEAIEAGVFGVPTINLAGRNFWGYEATDMVLACAAAHGDESVYPGAAIAAAARLSSGTQRQRGKPPAIIDRVATTLAPRIPYLPEDLAEPAELVTSVRQRRGGRLIELDRMLLYSQPLARGWNAMMGAMRSDFSLSPKLGELAMCAVGILNGAHYEFEQHAPLWIAAGATTAQVEAIRNPVAAMARTDLFDPGERAALALCIEMTLQVKVSDATFAQIAAHLPHTELVELIATIAAYNMVSRFLVALNVQMQPEYQRAGT